MTATIIITLIILGIVGWFLLLLIMAIRQVILNRKKKN